MGLYGIADVVFVGKSLCAHGSQNMIEPCLCGKPTFVGPYTENFRPVMSDLLAANAIVQVKDERELEEWIVGAFESGSGVPVQSGSGVPPLQNEEGNVHYRSGETPLPPSRSVKELHSLGARAAAAVARRFGVVAKCVTEIRGAIG